MDEELSAVSAAVIFGAPALVSAYVKVAEVCPAGMVTLVIVLPLARRSAVALVVVSLTVCAVEVAPGLPLASSSDTVIVPLLVPATGLTGALVIATWVATDDFTVSVWFEEELSAASAAVTVGFPACISP